MKPTRMPTALSANASQEAPNASTIWRARWPRSVSREHSQSSRDGNLHDIPQELGPNGESIVIGVSGIVAAVGCGGADCCDGGGRGGAVREQWLSAPAPAS